MNAKRLYRSRDERMLAGVCGGLGEYFSIDPTIIRLALLLLAIWGGGGILAYIIAWLVIPEEPLPQGEDAASVVPAQKPETAPAQPAPAPEAEASVEAPAQPAEPDGESAA
ncbi:MAG: PspC domain-containing protein [Caldilineales bacterium]|nr:PspC domain-containing protein [Caldilineales bacterium]